MSERERQALKALDEATAQARKVYEEAMAQAEEMKEQAWKVFKKTRDQAEKAYVEEYILERAVLALYPGLASRVEAKAQAEKEKEEKIPAICPVCGEPVENVFYDGEGKLYADPSHGIIVSEGNQAYHMRPGQDCWGKHTGYPNFKEA